jgi:hypothetical protein
MGRRAGSVGVKLGKEPLSQNHLTTSDMRTQKRRSLKVFECSAKELSEIYTSGTQTS